MASRGFTVTPDGLSDQGWRARWPLGGGLTSRRVWVAWRLAAPMRSFYLTHVPVLLVASGVILRIEQYLHRRSLWLDEASLAQAVHGALSHIAHAPGGQAPPIGFALVEHTSVSAFGNNEYALRFFPLLCGLASIFVFASLARRLLRPAAVPVALALFCFSPSLLYFSGEVKHYASDVLFTLVVLLGAMRLHDAPRIPIRRAIGYGIVGAAAVLFSHPAMFVLGGASAVLIAERALTSRWKDVGALVVGSAVWTAGFVAAYLISLRNLSNNQNLLEYWSVGFPPRPLGLASATRWVGHRFSDALHYPAGFRSATLAALAGAAGVAALLVRRRGWTLALLLAPVPLLLVAAAARKYPAHDRLLLFLMPVVILILVASMDLVPEGRFRPAKVAIVALLVYISAGPVAEAAARYVHPIERAETRQVFEFVHERWRTGDALYVDYGAFPAYRVYASATGIRADRVVISEPGLSCDAPAGISGAKRIWLVFSDHRRHETPTYRRAVFAHLSASARPVVTMIVPGAQATLFDSGLAPLETATPSGLGPMCLRLVPLEGAGSV